MRDIIVYVLIAVVYKVESRTFCDDLKCVCSDKENSLRISCSSQPNVLDANYSLPITVKFLDLSRNNLTRIKRSPSLASETLTDLLLVNNQISEITTEAFTLPSLERLDLSYNRLEFIHRDTFASLKNLTYLNLANNKFSVFGNLNFYYLKKLQTIILDNNAIGPSLEYNSLFEGGYNLTSKVQSISLNNVNLTSNNKNIFDYVNYLKNLSLAENNITEIFGLCHGLEYLNLCSNPIRDIPGKIFLDSFYLIELKLNNILIEEVSDLAFVYLDSLRYLELEDNRRLKRFSSLAWGRIERDRKDVLVEKMSLRGSSLTTLDPELEGLFKKIKKIDLRDNPWHCDCQLKWFRNIEIPNELADFRCSTPQRLFNRSVLELDSTEFVCEKLSVPAAHYVRTGINIAVYCTLLVITVLMMYFFIFSPKPFMYRHLPVEFPRTP